jgi:signal transduction histidine kinase
MLSAARFWRRLRPRSLANRTALLLLAGLAVIELTGLIIYTFDRLDLQRLAQTQEMGLHVSNLYRSVAMAAPSERQSALRDMDPGVELSATLDSSPLATDLEPAPPPIQRSLRIAMQYTPVPNGLRWHQLIIRGTPFQRRLLVSLELPTGEWLNVTVPISIRRFLPFWSPAFLVSFILMFLGSAALVVWAVRQFTAPMRDLAAAAERLGTDVNTPPLPERGTLEVIKAARAFNVMAERIRRFVRDRTFLLTAIGHDLRTPITRLKLRAEWMDDEEQQAKMLADLDELEGMVAATLAFGRDDATAEGMRALDLAELLRTILDEASDARSDVTELTTYEGPDHQVVRARPVAIKRALTNLVQNALNYGLSAHVILMPARDGMLTVVVEDDGPGIPSSELDRVFEPFFRLEPSRNRETGGTGLGLPIARNIVRAHGGDVSLANRPAGGLRATVTLPG